MLAKDIMTTGVVTAASDTSIEAISHLMMTHNVSGLPVVNEQGAILGIVTEGDLILREQTEAKDPRLSSWWLRLLSDRKTDEANYIKTHGTRADEVMTRDVVTVSEDAPVGDIVRVLAEMRVKRVPVTRDGTLVGIVSRINLLRGLATRTESRDASPTSDDRTIKQKILQEVEAQGWITHGSLNVIVTGGVVELWGRIGARAARAAAFGERDRRGRFSGRSSGPYPTLSAGGLTGRCYAGGGPGVNLFQGLPSLPICDKLG